MINLRDPTILETDAVHVWNIDLNDDALDLPELLSVDEISRFSRISHQTARIDYLRTRVALRIILASYLEYPAAEIVFSYNKNSKPELSQESQQLLRFNLSHSGRYCLLAVTTECDIGIDIERTKAGRDYAALAKRFFSYAENRLLHNCQDKSLFYRMWVLKEASVKARGLKLLAGLDRFQCSLTEDGVLSVTDRKKQDNVALWSAKQWQPDAHTVAAVVVRCVDVNFIDKSLVQ